MATQRKRAAQALAALKHVASSVEALANDHEGHIPDDAWEAVAEADAEYSVRMSKWVKDGDEESLANFRHAHTNLITAWEEFA
tara:strand:+ start:3374 stop:3622 length:249 start_codon:yes stop_codon:yes gene_type:complete